MTVPQDSMQPDRSLLLTDRARVLQTFGERVGRSALFAVASLSVLAVFFIFVFIGRDAWPFFQLRGVREFLLSTHWYPSAEHAEFGCRAIFAGTGLVTLGAALLAVPLGIAAAVCLSDILPFGVRQAVKPVIEMLAAVPSVAYGFFALVVLAPLLQKQGGSILSWAWLAVAIPGALLLAVILGDLAAPPKPWARWGLTAALAVVGVALAWRVGAHLRAITVESGTNALNVSIILGIMSLPTIVSVSEDALQSVGRDLREGSYALGATRAETLCFTIIPAASSGIIAAAILGIMRAVGETMVVWMASGNAAQIPTPWYNLLKPVRTLTATIAGDMGEADHVTGSARYHVLFAMGLSLLLMAFLCNLACEWVLRRQRRLMRGG